MSRHPHVPEQRAAQLDGREVAALVAGGLAAQAALAWALSAAARWAETPEGEHLSAGGSRRRAAEDRPGAVMEE